jgi:hypothetical protein
MTRLRFTIRDLLWLTVIVALLMMAALEIRYQWRLYMYSYGGIKNAPTRY